MNNNVSISLFSWTEGNCEHDSIYEVPVLLNLLYLLMQ